MPIKNLDEWLAASPRNRMFYAEEGLILEVTEGIWEAMSRKGWTKKDLADAITSSESYVTKVLNGSQEMTLSVLSRISQALDWKVSIKIVPRGTSDKGTSA